MIAEASYNDERVRFVIADRLATRMESEGEADSAGLFSRLTAAVTSTSMPSARIVVEAGTSFPEAAPITPQRPNLQPYAGQWVVISDNKVAEHGGDLADVVGRARARGESKPYVIFVEQLEEGVSRLSL